MRLVALPLALLLAACPRAGGGNECNTDEQCDGEVCGRDLTCTDASNVREVRTTWTISGQAATGTSCGGRELYITYQSDDSSDALSYSPVPCSTGQYLIDKLPKRYHSIELGVSGGSTFATVPIGATNMVSVDLVF